MLASRRRSRSDGEAEKGEYDWREWASEPDKMELRTGVWGKIWDGLSRGRC